MDERSRIAGELHDSVTQTLFSTAAIADALPEVWNRYPDKALQALEDLRLLTKGALAEMRTLLVEMRPSALLEKPLGELLKQMAEATVARTRMAVASEFDCQYQLPDDVQIALYRVAQEALNNIIKHSEAEQATLRLSCQDNAVELEIRDNGRGFEVVESSPGTMGLEIMRERVSVIGADMRVESQPGQGTVVRVSWHPKAGTNEDDRK